MNFHLSSHRFDKLYQKILYTQEMRKIREKMKQRKKKRSEMIPYI